MKFDIELKRQHDYAKEQIIRLVGDFEDSTDEGQYSYEVDVRRAFVVRGGVEREIPRAIVKSLDAGEEIYNALKANAAYSD